MSSRTYQIPKMVLATVVLVALAPMLYLPLQVRAGSNGVAETLASVLARATGTVRLFGPRAIEGRHNSAGSRTEVTSIASLPATALQKQTAGKNAVTSTETWTGDDNNNNNWTTNSNWSGIGGAGANDDLIFPQSAARKTNTNNFTDIDLNSLTFSGTGYVIGGNALSLTAGIVGNATSNTGTNPTLNPNITLLANQTFSNTGRDLVLNGDVDLNFHQLTLNGTNSILMNGTITGNGGIIKNGSGSAFLNGNATSLPDVLLDAGVLQIGGDGYDLVTLHGGRLTGTGTVEDVGGNSVGEPNDWVIAPGNGGNTTSIFNINHTVIFAATSTLEVDLNGTAVGTGYDQLIVGNTIQLNFANLSVSLGFTPATGQQFTIIQHSGPGIVLGQFAQGGSIIVNGRPFAIAYSQNGVVLTAGAPTAAEGVVSGNITATDGTPVSGAVIDLSGSQARKTITDASGNYYFDAVETGGFYTVTPSRVNYNFNPFNRSFSQLGNRSEAMFTGTSTGGNANPLDTPEYFVRQHYLDFLGREPDEAGFNFWSDQMLECGADADCQERRRVNVSAAYFLSIEFQETGGLVDGLYRASYGRRPTYVEFVPDSSAIAQSVVVGRTDWERQLETNKAAFVGAWVQRATFIGEYGNLSDDAYVDQLISHTGVSYAPSERAPLVAGLTDGTLTRAAVLRRVVENQSFIRAKRNQTFVMMQYFGYLRRDPDESGYQFWLNKLNEFDGNFEQAEMVKAFLVSGEYRQRFAGQ